MSKSECINHAKKHSKSYIEMEFDETEKKYVKIKDPHFSANSPWVTDENAMCKKNGFASVNENTSKICRNP